MLRGLSTIHAAFAALGLAAIGPGAGVLPGTPDAAQAQSFIDPNSGIDFVTVGAVNNPAWTGTGSANNRGSVGYEYNIGKFEVTTAQWAEFMNAAYDRPVSERISFLSTPAVWGATFTAPNTPGGLRWNVPAGNEMYPVGGISWRSAAIFCNWLQNGKSLDRAAFLNGAYDVSTFGTGPTGFGFTDQLTHSPGARYWIPTADEWMKAAHYDPNKPNADGTIGGWWQYSTTSDTMPVYGPPGYIDEQGRPAQANAAWTALAFPGMNPFATLLGSYDVTSPWGLYDVAGGTREWTEHALYGTPDATLPEARYLDGSAWTLSPGDLANMDRVTSIGGAQFPNSTALYLGLRVASAVPTPGSILMLLVLSIANLRRRSK